MPLKMRRGLSTKVKMEEEHSPPPPDVTSEGSLDGCRYSTRSQKRKKEEDLAMASTERKPSVKEETQVPDSAMALTMKRSTVKEEAQVPDSSMASTKKRPLRKHETPVPVPRRPTIEEWNCYAKKVNESEGDEVSLPDGVGCTHFIHLVKEDNYELLRLSRICERAIGKYNDEEGIELEFKDIIKVTSNCLCFYITFMVGDPRNGNRNATFQAQARCSRIGTTR